VDLHSLIAVPRRGSKHDVSVDRKVRKVRKVRVMSKRVRVNKVVRIEEGIAYSRSVRSNTAGMQPDGQLQDILLEQGQQAVEDVARRWYHGLERKPRNAK